MGRRKIEIKMVKSSSSRQVTFSKRRTGLFKKANELATLCGAEVAIVVFSPGGKPFSFGHPSVDSVAGRFLNKQLEDEKKKGETLEKAIEGLKPKPLEEQNLAELVTLKGTLEELLQNLKRRTIEMEASSSLLLLSKKTTEEYGL